MKKKLIILNICFIFFISLDLIIPKIIKLDIYQKYNNIDYLRTYYEKKELDESLNFRHDFHGNNCIKRGLTQKKMHWHPRYGGQDKIIDTECINEMFAKKKKNIVFMGNSAMANGLTPNYLTSIEYYLFKDDLNSYRSVNLAESAARMSNTLSMFIEYIPKIKNIDAIFFIGGYNEILPLLHNGKYDDDFYWTAGVKKRVHKPFSFLIETYTKNSFVLGLRNKVNIKINDDDIVKSIEDFKYRKKIFLNLCKIYNIKCFMYLQPILYKSKNMNGKSYYDLKNIFMEQLKFSNVFIKGYKLLEADKDLISLVKLFDDKENIYTDDVHFDKYGAKLIAKEMKKQLTMINND